MECLLKIFIEKALVFPRSGCDKFCDSQQSGFCTPDEWRRILRHPDVQINPINSYQPIGFYDIFSSGMNLKHLRYFWAVAHARSVVQAAKQLHLAPQTVSAQIKLLEGEMGAALFRAAGRGLELTEAGRIALSYADEIFTLTDEMAASLRAQAGATRPAFHVGVSNVVPKSLAFSLLSPLGALPEPVRLVCLEGLIDGLLADLALHRLDIVVADRPLPPGLSIRGHSHKLGESALSFFAAPALAGRFTSAFPACLDGAPVLLPSANAAVRVEIDRWLGAARFSPQVVGEFDDGALMKAFGQAGGGFFPAPAVLAGEICARYKVREIGRVAEVREAFWLISAERRIRHPAVRVMLDVARTALFAAQPDA
jgi:LysR family transcriptional regulator, transcriptional activator of nhaA